MLRGLSKISIWSLNFHFKLEKKITNFMRKNIGVHRPISDSSSIVPSHDVAWCQWPYKHMIAKQRAFVLKSMPKTFKTCFHGYLQVCTLQSLLLLKNHSSHDLNKRKSSADFADIGRSAKHRHICSATSSVWNFEHLLSHRWKFIFIYIYT